MQTYGAANVKEQSRWQLFLTGFPGNRMAARTWPLHMAMQPLLQVHWRLAEVPLTIARAGLGVSLPEGPGSCITQPLAPKSASAQQRLSAA